MDREELDNMVDEMETNKDAVMVLEKLFDVFSDGMTYLREVIRFLDNNGE